MRIVIDYRPALRARTGVGEHIHQIAAHLARNRADDITVFSSSWKDRLPSDLPRHIPGARVVDRRIPVSMLNLSWHRLQWPPIEALAGGAFDVAHSPHPLLMPVRAAAQVVTIHDLYFLSNPERTSAEIRRDYASLAAAHARRADRIIVVSRFVAGEVHRLLDVPRDRISVCMNGAPEWTTAPARAGSDGYILFVGTLEPRKNLSGLLEAYGRLITRHANAPRLVIAGGLAAGADAAIAAAERAPLAGRVEFRGYVPPHETEALFKGAQMFVLPSFDEGFGIPALEAMAAGVPVIASNRGGLPEVVGDAGLLIDPDDPESLTSAMLMMIGDSSLRANLAVKGLERARLFTWSQTARDVRSAYEEALLARRRRAPIAAAPAPNVHNRDAHRH